MKYKSKARSYNIYTPRRRKLTLLIRGKPNSVSNQVMSDGRFGQLILKNIGISISKEISLICSDKVCSILRGRKEDLMSFTWAKLLQEVKKNTDNCMSSIKQKEEL